MRRRRGEALERDCACASADDAWVGQGRGRDGASGERAESAQAREPLAVRRTGLADPARLPRSSSGRRTARRAGSSPDSGDTASSSARARGDSGGVGRRLEFLLQEMAREVNTIGSKGADVPVAHLVVELKTELERMREQVLNVE